ncbi:MAG: nuclear transport factor 2 family protein [Acidimicrobiales bacterium]
MNRSDVERWIENYERAWRTAGTDGLADLFSPDASYLPSPWAAPVEGLATIARFWEDEREGPDESFTMAREILAVERATAVVRVSVDYDGGETAPPQRWRDLWVIRFDGDGRCVAFEEWPFATGQRDDHEHSA